jgi:hypothetical protein
MKSSYNFYVDPTVLNLIQNNSLVLEVKQGTRDMECLNFIHFLQGVRKNHFEKRNIMKVNEKSVATTVVS